MTNQIAVLDCKPLRARLLVLLSLASLILGPSVSFAGMGSFSFSTGTVFAGPATEVGLPRTLHVSASATPRGDGSSWERALTSVEDALELARADDTVTQIWVARGVYGRRSGEPLSLVGDIDIRGGFAGYETRHADADPDVNPTVLSGLDDRGRRASIVVARGVHGVRFDGLTFREGGGDAPVVYLEDSGVQFIDCRFEDNDSLPLRARSSSTVLRDVVFAGNSDADHPRGTGVVAVEAGSLDIARTTFRDNVGTRGVLGVFPYRDESIDLDVVDTTFSGNRAWDSLVKTHTSGGTLNARFNRVRMTHNWLDPDGTTGGWERGRLNAIIQTGVETRGDSVLEIKNTIIAENQATAFYGAGGGWSELMNTTIFRNESFDESAGIYVDGHNAFVVNSVIAENCRREYLWVDDGDGSFVPYWSGFCRSDEAANVSNTSSSASRLVIETSAVPQWEGRTAASTWNILTDRPRLIGWGMRPYTPMAGSPLLDAGDARAYDGGSRDVYGKRRFRDAEGLSLKGEIDIGAVERQ